jgi:hypothetical protein
MAPFWKIQIEDKLLIMLVHDWENIIVIHGGQRLGWLR